MYEDVYEKRFERKGIKQSKWKELEDIVEKWSKDTGHFMMDYMRKMVCWNESFQLIVTHEEKNLEMT